MFIRFLQSVLIWKSTCLWFF